MLYFVSNQPTNKELHLVQNLRVTQPIKEVFHLHFTDTRISPSRSVELVPVLRYTCSVPALKYVSEVPSLSYIGAVPGLSYSLAVRPTPVHFLNVTFNTKYIFQQIASSYVLYVLHAQPIPTSY